MKQIIESIKSNREELISKYFGVAREMDVLSEGIKQVKKMGKENLCESLRNKRLELRSAKANLNIAIKDLGDALNKLGERTETFLG